MSSIMNSIGNILGGGSSTNASQSAALADPFASQRGQYQTDLSKLVNNPSSVTKTPGYQFQFDQGMQALERQQAGSGSLNSGQSETAAIKYGQGMATSSLTQQEQLLTQLAGGNLGQGNAGSVYASGMQTSSNILRGLAGNGLSSLEGMFGGMFGGGAAAGADAGGADALLSMAALA